MKEDLANSHAIEIELLESKISRMEVPRVKFSKRVIELTRSENELVRLKLYDDAARVRRMLGQIQPREETAWAKKFEDSIQDMYVCVHACNYYYYCCYCYVFCERNNGINQSFISNTCATACLIISTSI